MELRILCKHLVADELNGKFTVGENNADTVGIELPRFYDQHDLSQFSFRITAAGECENAAAQILEADSINEKTLHLLWNVTSDFTSIPEEFTLVLTGVNADNSVAIKFKSYPISVNPDKSWKFMPSPELSEQLLNQVQAEFKNTLETVDKKISEYEINPATAEKIGGIKSGEDISISGDGLVTVNSVKGKTLGKSVPADAIFTDTVYTLPKATIGTLGGVKVDGKTIMASEDGTISANGVQNLAVQIALPNNCLIYDDLGKPSVMVAIPKFYLDEVIEGASHTVHPAFIINGVEQNLIYISKYQNIVENNRAYSLPMKTPTTYITLEQAWNSCKNKGEGWHLMTNAEWAAIALWCRKNGTMPNGNNNYGKDVSETNLPQNAVPANHDNNGKTVMTLTGSGSESWYHNGTFTGITDLNGNIWEYIVGLRLVNGEIQIIPNNNIAAVSEPIAFGQNALWKAIMPNNSLVEPGTSGTLKYDITSASCCLNTVTSSNLTSTVKFSSITSKNITDVPDYIKALTLFPTREDNYCDDTFLVSTVGTVIPVAGGKHSMGNNSGIFCKSIGNHSTSADVSTGFRCAYYDPN